MTEIPVFCDDVCHWHSAVNNIFLNIYPESEKGGIHF